MLAAFADETRTAGARPVLMLIGTGAQVHPNAAASARFAAAIGVADLGYPVRRLLAAAERIDLPVINLPAVMAERAERDGALLHGFLGGRPGFGHWNAAGHEVAGETAAALVCTMLEPEVPDRTGSTDLIQRTGYTGRRVGAGMGDAAGLRDERPMGRVR